MSDRPIDPYAITNPRRALARREQEAGLTDSPSLADPRKGTDKGDLQGPSMDFFKPRDRSKDQEGLAKALKNRK